MKSVAIILLAVIASPALAASKTAKPATYFVNGKQVTNVQALDAAFQHTEVLQCKSVVLAPSKSGTSFSLKPQKAVKEE